MTVIACEYIRKPLVVNGVRVTEENFSDVAEWCGGTIHWIEDGSELFKNGHKTGTIDPKSGADPVQPKKQFIKIRVINPRNSRQSKAYIGDWVLRSGSGCKIYTNKAFTNNFNPVEEKQQGQAEADADLQPEMRETDVRHSKHS